jgi:hypothetical protein
MTDIILALLNVTICLGGAWVCVQVQQHQLPAVATAASGILTMLVWMYTVRCTQLTLVAASACYDVATALGYFAGFALCEQHISWMQWVGVMLLMTGLLLINFN